MIQKCHYELALVKRELYLDEVSSRLRGRLSPLEVYESMEEMRSHLDAMAAAYVELGLYPDAAMDAAMQKFGSSHHIATQIAGTTRRSGSMATAIAFLNTLVAEAALGAVFMAVCDFLIISNHRTMSLMLGGDVFVGGIVGAVIGMFAWYTRRQASVYAAFLCVGLNLFMSYTLYSTYILLGEADITVELAILLTISVWILGVAGVRISRRLRELVPSEPPRPNRSAIGS